jgi:hypothetical protein
VEEEKGGKRRKEKKRQEEAENEEEEEEREVGKGQHKALSVYSSIFTTYDTKSVTDNVY